MTIVAPSEINLHDSAKYKPTYNDDPAVSFGAEDDFQITRARYTRKPRKVHKIGFTFVDDATKVKLEQLWLDAMGGSEIITGFNDPTTGTGVDVRFKRGTIPVFEYKGRGGVHYWDIRDFVLVEV